MNTPDKPKHASRIEIEVSLNPDDLPEQARRDLEANAQLKRTTPAQLLSDIIASKLREPFIVKPRPA